MAGPRVEAVGDRVFVIVFPSEEDITPEKCEPLIAELESASKAAPIAVLAEVPPLRGIHPSMITFGLTTMTGSRVNVRLVGAVAKSAAVRIALRAIQAALKVYGKDLEVASHESREAAVSWARDRLTQIASVAG